jgi:hypothetical protein
MTKAATKAQRRRRAKSRTITLPGGESAPVRLGQGDRPDRDPHPQSVGIAARVRKGVQPQDALAPAAGCAVGRRLMAQHPAEAPALFAAATHMRRTYHAYAVAMGLPPRHAKCMSILTPPETMTTHADAPPPDLRNARERQDQATAAFMRLHGWLGYVDAAARSACVTHVLDEPDATIRDWHGVVLTLRCVAEGLRGEAVTARVRKGVDR